ncbi:hypothetical protein QN277_016416 [Acacia crassicarpa]|uniref:Uncharacterized protein n=1 Tax=Acacia crassicarpa TaxID=499986 RepID=A0AAE1MWK7_9FABA|nr:hypothetical protein QN277_016416 [Acacia crassicarpa]
MRLRIVLPFRSWM